MSVDEYKSARVKHFAKADANKDGKVDAKEMEVFYIENGKSMDKDGDGTVTVGEFKIFFAGDDKVDKKSKKSKKKK